MIQYLYNIRWFEVDNRRYCHHLHELKKSAVFLIGKDNIICYQLKIKTSNIIIIIRQNADLTKICLIADQS